MGILEDPKMVNARLFDLVKFDFASLGTEFYAGYPFQAEKGYKFLGRLPGGQIVVMDPDNYRVFRGYQEHLFVDA